MKPIGHQRATRAACLAIAAALALTMIPAVAWASREAPTTSASTYKLKPAKERVDVGVTMSITNRTPNRVTTGPCPNAPSSRCRITTFFTYGAMAFVAPTAAQRVRFTGTGVRSKVIRRKRGWTLYEVSFSPIRQGQSRQIRATYQLPAARPRSPNTTRVLDAYSHFCWHGQFTDRGSVTAFLPRGYETTNRHAAVKTRTTKKGVTMRAKRKKQPGKFYACTDAFNPEKLLRTETTSPNGQMVVVEGWPEDPDWTASISEGVETTIPALETLIGTPILAPDVKIRQVAMQALEGYAGDFQLSSGQIRVSERLDDPKLIAHEMAHAWFHGGTLKETWMIEGLAEWAAAEVTDSECEEPGDYPGKGSPRLRDWRFIGADPTDRQLSIVEYQYASACAVTSHLASLIGNERMKDVTQALLFEFPKYGGDWDKDRGRPDWREWLDAFDELGLVPSGLDDLEIAERHLLDLGIARKKQLKGRAETRSVYHQALQTTLQRAMPIAVREAMDAWRWDRARNGIRIATETITAGDELVAQGVEDSGLRSMRRDLAGAKTMDELRAVRDRVLAIAAERGATGQS